MEFDRIVTRASDAIRVNGIEQAVKTGRKAWSYKRIFREVKHRMNQNRFSVDFDFRRSDRQEQRYIAEFEKEFTEDPVDHLERQMTEFLQRIRR